MNMWLNNAFLSSCAELSLKTISMISKYNIGINNNPTLSRAVASLTVPGGQEFQFPHFSSNFDQFSLFFLNFYSFSSSFLPSGWATRPPGKALATPLALS